MLMRVGAALLAGYWDAAPLAHTPEVARNPSL
jgi:hypothetical protein